MCEPIDLYSTEPVSTFYLVWYGDADFNIGAYQRVHSPDSSREEVFAGGQSGDPSHSCSVPFSRHYEFLEVRWGIFPPDSSDMWPRDGGVDGGRSRRVTRQSITCQVSLTFMVLPLILLQLYNISKSRTRSRQRPRYNQTHTRHILKDKVRCEIWGLAGPTSRKKPSL